MTLGRLSGPMSTPPSRGSVSALFDDSTEDAMPFVNITIYEGHGKER
jgi:hypothetical protein